MNLMHDWRATDERHIEKCARCGWESTPSVGMMRAFGFRKDASQRWQFAMPECATTKELAPPPEQP